MQRLLSLALGVLTVVCIGCAHSLPRLPSESEEPTPIDLRSEFVRSEQAADKILEIAPFERLVVAIADSEPFRLGPLASAIFRGHPTSLAGHFAAHRFYSAVGEEIAASHMATIETIVDHMAEGRDGTLESPYRALTTSEGYAFLLHRDHTPLGAAYGSTEKYPFVVLVSAQGPDKRISRVVFDLSSTLEPIRSYALDFQKNRSGNASKDTLEFHEIIGFLALMNDPAAQIFIGQFYAAEDNFNNSIHWLSNAAQTDSALANLTLGRVYWQQSLQVDDAESRMSLEELAENNFLHAVGAGFDSAMFDLAKIYLRSERTEDERENGFDYLRRAIGLGNTNAMRYLARLQAYGMWTPQDLDATESLLYLASRMGNEGAKREYIEFMLNSTNGRDSRETAVAWLHELARDENPGAMIELGKLYALGRDVKQSYRRARHWFRKAVAQDPTSSEVVNHVAWILTVSHLNRLRNPRYALRIIERLMESNENARSNPAFIDTWAAAYASLGNFDRAVELQREALAKGEKQEVDENIMTLLQQHLDDFSSGKQVIEELPKLE